MKRFVYLILIVVVAGWFWWSRSKGSLTTTDPSPTPKPAGQTIVTETPLTVTVQEDEGLWHIAARELGDGRKWSEIAEANMLKKPYILYVGQQLKIPGKVTEVVTEQEGVYSLEQIAEHNSKDSCWMAIEGKVYDVTEFVASGFHPGKAAILEGCGKDTTELFNTRPMGSGTKHSERARKMLPKYLIGELAQ